MQTNAFDGWVNEWARRSGEKFLYHVDTKLLSIAWHVKHICVQHISLSSNGINQSVCNTTHGLPSKPTNFAHELEAVACQRFLSTIHTHKNVWSCVAAFFSLVISSVSQFIWNIETRHAVGVTFNLVSTSSWMNFTETVLVRTPTARWSSIQKMQKFWTENIKKNRFTFCRCWFVRLEWERKAATSVQK